MVTARRVIDGYTHCGLSKYEPIERVREVLAAANVERAVLVQHLGEYDNAYLGRIAQADPGHFAAVCLVDHEQAGCCDALRRWAQSGCFKGVRLTTDALVARPELFDAAAEVGLIVVFYAPEGMAAALAPLSGFFARHRQARLVVTHLGNPRGLDAARLAAGADLLPLAEYPQIYLQLSGMKMFSPWPHDALYPLIAVVCERFGPSRLYWGSNYPVVGDVDDYRRDLDLLLDGKLPVPAEAIGQIAGGNAQRLWFPESRRGQPVDPLTNTYTQNGPVGFGKLPDKDSNLGLSG